VLFVVYSALAIHGYRQWQADAVRLPAGVSGDAGA
jgi:hypothetical protein